MPNHIYQNLKPIHKEIFDQLSFAEFAIVNAKSYADFEDPTTYATRQFVGLYEDFNVIHILSFAKIAIKHKLFTPVDLSSDLGTQAGDFAIVAHYRSQLERWFSLVNKGYTPIFGGVSDKRSLDAKKRDAEEQIMSIVKPIIEQKYQS